jgi:preprotein translocase subunit SecF
MSRCLNTSITTLITIVALLLFVGGAIQNFVWVLLIGVLVGTFDSICIAPSLLVVFETGRWGKFVQPAPASK